MASSKIQYHVDSERRLVVAFAVGVLDFADFDLHVHELFQDPLFVPGLNGLYDFTAVPKIVGNAAFMEKASEQITDPNNVPETAKIAILTDGNPTLERIFNGWKVMMADTQVIYETFIDKEQAEAWLGQG